jgi:hypothetical protein
MQGSEARGSRSSGYGLEPARAGNRRWHRHDIHQSAGCARDKGDGAPIGGARCGGVQLRSGSCGCGWLTTGLAQE